MSLYHSGIQHITEGLGPHGLTIEITVFWDLMLKYVSRCRQSGERWALPLSLGIMCSLGNVRVSFLSEISGNVSKIR
jgi:hypothetical protein